MEQNREARAVSVRSLADWVADIKEAFARGRASTLELAKVVYAARRRLLFGQWTALWRSGHRQLPFSKTKGELLSAIGKGFAELNVHHGARLPSALKTLYCLAQIDRTLLIDLINRRSIRPTLTLKQAQDLLALHKPESHGKPRRSQVKRRLSNFTEFVRTTLPDWTPEERETARLALVELAQEIASCGNAAAVQPGCSADFQSVVSPISNRQGEKIASDINTTAVPERHTSSLNGNRRLVSPSLELLKLRPQPSL